MRKSLLIALFLSFVFGSFAQTKAFLGKSRPPMFLIGTLDIEGSKFGDFKRPDFAGIFNSIGVEHVFDYGSSFQLMGGAFSFPSLLGFEVNGFSIMPEYRYYFKENAPYGLYISPHMMLHPADNWC